MRNIDATLTRRHLEMLWNHRDSEILTTETPSSAPLRLLQCWDPPMPTLLLFDQGSGAQEGQREGSGLGGRHPLPPLPTLSLGSRGPMGMQLSLQESRPPENPLLIHRFWKWSNETRFTSQLNVMLVCAVVEFALVLQAADEIRCAVIFLCNGVAQSLPPSLSCYLSVALAHMYFFETCPCVFFRPHFHYKAECTIFISLTHLTPGKIHGFCIQNADYSAHCWLIAVNL